MVEGAGENQDPSAKDTVPRWAFVVNKKVLVSVFTMTKYHRIAAGLGWQRRADKYGLSRVRVGADSYLGGVAGITVRDLARHLAISTARTRACLRREGLWEGYLQRGALSEAEARQVVAAFRAVDGARGIR